MIAQETGASAEEVRGALEAILARPEFHPEEGFWGGVGELLSELLDALTAPAGVSEFASAVLVVGLVAAAVWLALRLWWRRHELLRDAQRAQAPGGDRRREDVGALLRAAREARAAGDLRGALRWTWFALVVGLGERGSLAYRAAWTNRELLERGEPSAGARALLEPLLVEIEEREFGRVPVTAADVDRLQAVCDRALGEGGA